MLAESRRISKSGNLSKEDTPRTFEPNQPFEYIIPILLFHISRFLTKNAYAGEVLIFEGKKLDLRDVE